MSFAKIKLHREKNQVHQQAEEEEFIISNGKQPSSWCITQQQQAIRTLMAIVISIYREDSPLDTLESRCRLMETLGVTALLAEETNVNYRNKDATLVFAQAIASCLHEELVAKVKASPVIGVLTCP